MASIEDVARLAKVSTATVSRVLNGSGYASEKATKSVLGAVQQLNYRPNNFARGLASSQSDCIGVVVPELSNPFFGTMLQSIEGVVRQRGMQMMVASGNRDTAEERRAIDWLQRYNCDAQILFLTATSDNDLSDLIEGTPSVVIGRYVPELQDRSIYLNDIEGGQLATQYLIDQGHTHIAYLGFTFSDGFHRRVGYSLALEKAQLSLQPDLMVEAPDFSEEAGYRATERLLARGVPFTALFAVNDQLASGALMALRDHNIRVPHDVSVIGYDDVPMARFLYPALTTIHQPIHDMALSAVELAIAAAKHVAVTEVKTRFEPALVVRDSVTRRL